MGNPIEAIVNRVSRFDTLESTFTSSECGLAMPSGATDSPTSTSDDHSELEPLLPIPNRTVKRLSADDSEDPRAKVGHRQAPTKAKAPTTRLGPFAFADAPDDPYSSAATTGHQAHPFISWPVAAQANFTVTDREVKGRQSRPQPQLQA